MNRVEQVKKFLDEAGVFYVATVDGNKPKVRPIGFSMINGDKLWFGVGTFKDVYKQLVSNPNIEIVCVNKDKWLRYNGEVKFVEDKALENKCLDLLGPIGNMYRENSWRMGMFYIDRGHVEIKSIINTIEEFDL